MTDTDSDITDSEVTWVDDVRNVDWFFLKSGKSKGESKGVLITHQGMAKNKL